MIAIAGPTGKSLPVVLVDKTFAIAPRFSLQRPGERIMAEPTPETTAEAAQAPAEGAPAAEQAPTAESVDQAAEAPTSEAEAGETASAGLDAPVEQAPAQADIDLSQLPLHTRSLLKIRVAVSVKLAEQRRPIQEIIEMGPGTLVKFEKTYDEPLELTVGDLPVARGEVVKVGDKFGLRIGKIIRAHERFASVR
jgi:flagellar motor switch protein FliN/FliY